MERERRTTLHWGLLLVVYWSIVFASAMIELTSELSSLYFLVLLIAGVPVYLVASRAIMREYDVPEVLDSDASESARIIPFPNRNPDEEVELDAAHAALHARAPRMRKHG